MRAPFLLRSAFLSGAYVRPARRLLCLRRSFTRTCIASRALERVSTPCAVDVGTLLWTETASLDAAVWTSRSPLGVEPSHTFLERLPRCVSFSSALFYRVACRVGASFVASVGSGGGVWPGVPYLRAIRLSVSPRLTRTVTVSGAGRPLRRGAL